MNPDWIERLQAVRDRVLNGTLTDDTKAVRTTDGRVIPWQSLLRELERDARKKLYWNSYR